MNWKIFKRSALFSSGVSSKALIDFIFTAAAQGVGPLVSFLTAMLITTKLGVDKLGAYALILSISTFVATLIEVAAGQTAMRYASIAIANKEVEKCNQILAWSINIRILFACFSLLIGVALSGWLANNIWNNGTLGNLILYAFSLGAAVTLQQSANAYFYTNHYFKFISLTTFLNSIFTLGGALIFDKIGMLNLESLLILSIVSALATFFLVLLKTPWRDIYKINERQKWPIIALKLKSVEWMQGTHDVTQNIAPHSFAFYLLTSSLIVTVFMRLDIWMIGAFLSETDVGIYRLASYFAVPLALALGSLNTILWPRASKLVAGIAIQDFMRKTIKLTLLLVLPALVYMISLRWIPQLIFPEEPAIVSGLAIALCVRYVLATLITPIGVIGYSMGMSRVYVLVNSLQLITIFWINYKFLPIFGLYAPAFALIISELISIVVIWPIIKKRFKVMIQ